MSRKEAGRLETIRRAVGMTPEALGYRLGAEEGRNALLVACAVNGQPLPAGALEAVAHGARQVFPVKAADLMPDYTGPALGEKLRALEEAWIDSGFTLSREALLAQG